MQSSFAPARVARLHRMVLPDHVCPYGLKSRWLLQRHGFVVDDHHLRTRLEVEQFKRKFQVKTTPQVFIDGQRVGGYDELRRYLSRRPAFALGTSYVPMVLVLLVVVLMSLAAGEAGGWAGWHALERFGALGVTTFAVLKLRDVEGFSTTFLHYDLLARRWVPYAYLYPFAEAAAGLLMLFGGQYAAFGGVIAAIIGAIGAVSVAKAVYLDRQELKDAGLGGDSSTPLGGFALLLQLAMVALGVWMVIQG